jgi:peptidoglycan glycosyltransferase
MPSPREHIISKGIAQLTRRTPLSVQSLRALLLSLLASTTIHVSPGHAADNALDNESELVTTDPVVQAQIDRTLNRAPADRLAMRGSSQNLARDFSLSGVKRVSIRTSRDGDLALSERPKFDTRIGDRFAHATSNNNFVFYTVDADLQEYVSNLVNRAQATHVAVVAMEPSTGAILAMSGKSPSIKDLEYHAGFPAASLFKVVTAAAAVEHAGIDTHSLIPFRGGTYTLNQSNYYPDPRKDRRVMSVGEALGRSCNPVFGHLGIRYLNGDVLAKYARLFGFNRDLSLDAPLPESSAWIPQDSQYELSRTSAGFGEVRISPIHAAAFISGVANGGLLPRPQLIDTIVDEDGAVLRKQRPEMLQRIVQTSTAESLMEMMRYTTTVGTSRREFMRGSSPTLGAIDVAGKTGTLTGDNPVGLNNWFIGAAPVQNPKIALAVITVDPARTSKASHLARLVFQKYFGVSPVEPATPVRGTSVKKSKTTRKATNRTYAKKPSKKAQRKR